MGSVVDRYMSKEWLAELQDVVESYKKVRIGVIDPRESLMEQPVLRRLGVYAKSVEQVFRKFVEQLPELPDAIILNREKYEDRPETYWLPKTNERFRLYTALGSSPVLRDTPYHPDSPNFMGFERLRTTPGQLIFAEDRPIRYIFDQDRHAYGLLSISEKQFILKNASTIFLNCDEASTFDAYRKILDLQENYCSDMIASSERKGRELKQYVLRVLDIIVAKFGWDVLLPYIEVDLYPNRGKMRYFLPKERRMVILPQQGINNSESSGDILNFNESEEASASDWVTTDRLLDKLINLIPSNS